MGLCTMSFGTTESLVLHYLGLIQNMTFSSSDVPNMLMLEEDDEFLREFGQAKITACRVGESEDIACITLVRGDQWSVVMLRATL